MKTNIIYKISISAVVLAVAFALVLQIKAATAVNLGSADNFAVLAGSAITATTPSVVTGDVGLSPSAGTSYTGLTTAMVTGTIYAVDATGPAGASGNNATLVNAAKSALVSAYIDAAGQTLPSVTTVTESTTNSFNITGTTLAPGIYKSPSTMGITGTLTLNGSATDIWIFQAGSSLTTASAANIVLTGGAQACNVFWQVGSSATLGTGTLLKGNILALASITDNGGSTVSGRLLARDGAVTLNNTNVAKATCAVAAATVSGGGTDKKIAPENPQLTVIKHVINDNGGTAVASDFNTIVKIYGREVGSAPGQESPGRTYYLAETGTFTVSENQIVGYAPTFSGDCNAKGEVFMEYGDRKVCVITNDDVALFPPLINVTKIPTPLALPAGPGPVTYDYTVLNLGTVAMSNVIVTDGKCSAMNFVGGDVNGNVKLDTNETWKYRCSTTLSQTTTNTVTATGQANGLTAIDTANATVVVGAPIIPPLIRVVKKPSLFLLPAGGGAITYMYTVTNPGTEPLSDVSITDDKCLGLPGRVLGHPGDLNKNNLLESNEVWSFTCQTNLTKTTTNVGTAVGYANGLSAFDLSPATVSVAPPKLPNTGIDPNEKKAFWNIIVLAGIFVIVLTSVVANLRKKEISAK